jgi:hypothetical protein
MLGFTHVSAVMYLNPHTGNRRVPSPMKEFGTQR